MNSRKSSAKKENSSNLESRNSTPRLLNLYREKVIEELVKEFEYSNIMMVPKVTKVVVNVGLGEALTNARALESATSDITIITGQKPVATKAKRSVARFKLREGQEIGVMTTLRGKRMYIFLDKLFNTALPRIRDFRGIPRSAFDGRGNYSLGITEQIVFPEIDYNQVDRMRGLQVNIITTAKSDKEGSKLLELMGMPLARVQQ
ncbi:MAG: 50S ribosomal protein L5 [Chloroflexi bacterium]|nr:50S ribosomal protein L5 [Chloroflexota bacterium]